MMMLNVKNLAEQNAECIDVVMNKSNLLDLVYYGLVDSEVNGKLSSGKGVYGLVWKYGDLDVKYYGDVNEVEVLYEEDEREVKIRKKSKLVQVIYDEAYRIDLIRI